MDAKTQKRIQRYGWDKAADAYESGWQASLADAHTELLRMADARAGEHVLDLACGTGLVSLPIAKAVGRSGCVLASDISDEMVVAVDRAASRMGLVQLHAFRADAEALGMVPDAIVDLVTCALGLMYMPNPAQVMAEVLRVLKPGGRAVIAVWGERSRCGWAEIFPIVDARVKSSVCPFFFRLGTGSALENIMTSAGLVDVASTRLVAKLRYADDRAATKAAFAGGPVALAYNRFDAPTRAAAHYEYLESIAPFRTRDGYLIPGEFVVCKGARRLDNCGSE